MGIHTLGQNVQRSCLFGRSAGIYCAHRQLPGTLLFPWLLLSSPTPETRAYLPLLSRRPVSGRKGIGQQAPWPVSVKYSLLRSGWERRARGPEGPAGH